MGALQALTISDIRNINRDSLLRFLLFYPFLLGLLMRWLVPWITEQLYPRFDLVPYYSLIVGFFGILVTPQVAGFVIGFLLLDERDDGTLTALRVTPLSLNCYLTYRLAVPALISVAAMFVVIPLVDLIPVSYVKLLPIALMAALEGPIFALMLASLAANKVQGFAVMKGLGIFLLVPIVAWFVPMPWQLLLAVFPTYWPIKAFWMMLDGGPWLAFTAAGTVYHLIVLALLVRRFDKMVART